MNTRERVLKLADERPDLLPLVRRLLSAPDVFSDEGENPDDLAELARRGIIEHTEEQS